MAKKTTKSAEEIAAEASKKEMEAKRDEITAYYKDSIKHLKVQLEYEDLLKDIEKARAVLFEENKKISKYPESSWTSDTTDKNWDVTY